MRKLKSVFVMILILSILLMGTILGIIVTKTDNKEVISEEPIEEIEVIPDTFVGKINNNVDAPGEIIKLITNYNDAYYLSIYTLEQVSTTDYFTNEIAGAISDDAIKLMVESRKLYDFDFTLTKATYDLTFTDCYREGDTYYVQFLMNDHMNFAFLGDICSETFDVENSMVIKLVGDQYKIDDYDKTQGYYMMFYDDNYSSASDVDDVYDYYLSQIKYSIEEDNYQKSQVEDTEYLASKTYDIAYDREKAVAYANKYYHSRNDNWYDFSDYGGNCQNYASQCLIAGGMIMDYYGENKWYYERPETYNRTVSWVQVPGFYKYCTNNVDSGLVCDTEANLYYAEKGDIIQVGISSVTHSTIVSDVVDGHILLNSNSIDMCNWPIEAYTYPTKQLIKILGSNY